MLGQQEEEEPEFSRRISQSQVAVGNSPSARSGENLRNLLKCLSQVEALKTSFQSAESKRREMEQQELERRYEAEQKRRRHADSQSELLKQVVAGLHKSRDMLLSGVAVPKQSVDLSCSLNYFSQAFNSMESKQPSPAESGRRVDVCSPNNIDVDYDCVICQDGLRTHAFVPCGHKVLCSLCAEQYIQNDASYACVVCRKPSIMLMQIFS